MNVHQDAVPAYQCLRYSYVTRCGAWILYTAVFAVMPSLVITLTSPSMFGARSVCTLTSETVSHYNCCQTVDCGDCHAGYQIDACQAAVTEGACDSVCSYRDGKPMREGVQQCRAVCGDCATVVQDIRQPRTSYRTTTDCRVLNVTACVQAARDRLAPCAGGCKCLTTKNTYKVVEHFAAYNGLVALFAFVVAVAAVAAGVYVYAAVQLTGPRPNRELSWAFLGAPLVRRVTTCDTKL
jgi:hypothetical protein